MAGYYPVFSTERDSYISLSVVMRNEKPIINVKNKEDYCLQRALRSALLPASDHADRPAKYPTTMTWISTWAESVCSIVVISSSGQTFVCLNLLLVCTHSLTAELLEAPSIVTSTLWIRGLYKASVCPSNVAAA